MTVASDITGLLDLRASDHNYLPPSNMNYELYNATITPPLAPSPPLPQLHHWLWPAICLVFRVHISRITGQILSKFYMNGNRDNHKFILPNFCYYQ